MTVATKIQFQILDNLFIIALFKGLTFCEYSYCFFKKFTCLKKVSGFMKRTQNYLVVFDSNHFRILHKVKFIGYMYLNFHCKTVQNTDLS